MLLWIMGAGALGSGARYLVGLWAFERLGAGFPYGTLIVNVSGSFALGFVANYTAASAWSPALRGAVVVGLLGGFTTYSSFNQETLAMLTHGSAGTAAMNIAITLAGCLAAGFLGLVVARQLVA